MPAAPLPCSGRPSPGPAGWQRNASACPLHSQPRGSWSQVLRPDLPQQHRDSDGLAPFLSPAAGTTSAAAARHGLPGGPGRRAHRQPVVDSCFWAALLSPVSPEPSQPARGSVLSTCLPVFSSLPPGPTSPLPRAALPPQGTSAWTHLHPGLLRGSRGPPSHPAVGRAPGFSPAPPEAHQGSHRALSLRPCLGPPVLLRRPPLQLFLCRRGRPESRLCRHPSSHSCPMRTLAHPPACQLEHLRPHRPRGRPRGQWACLLGLSRWGSGCWKSRVGWGFLEGHQHPCQPPPGWLTTAGMGLSPRGLSPRCQERRNKAAAGLLSAQSEIESGGEGVSRPWSWGTPVP